MTKRCIWTLAGALFALPVAGAGQGGGLQAWQDQTVADVEQMGDKFLSLADAFPEDMWDWAPMEGVRSVRDVMVLIVTEGHVFPGLWGADPPMGAASGFGAETARVAAMSKADLIAEMERSFNYMIASLRNMTTADITGKASWFGQATTGTGVVGHAVVDMHEHLGQSIAYARMNQIVPPWSR